MAIWDDGKELTRFGIEGIGYQKEIIKLKLKIYGIQKKIDGYMIKLGENVFEHYEAGVKDILTEDRVKELIDVIRTQKEEIESTRENIKEIDNEAKGILKKIKSKGEDVIDGIKKGIHTRKKARTSTKTEKDEAKKNTGEKKTESEEVKENSGEKKTEGDELKEKAEDKGQPKG